MNDFIARLNEYRAIYMGEPGLHSDQVRLTARILRQIDRPGRRRRYMASTATPSIDGYIDFVTEERVSHSVRNGEISTHTNPDINPESH